ncbi:MAG: (d)CMP kinase [Candidatus Jordarchaeum sp.]|uniref:(d)CMP kinase n=1 Tax=Candidatus Jordarchaeum sp. TaxID=2823881 RepID=UPI004049EF08
MGIVLTISGEHGVGKSACAKLLAQTLNLKYISSGEIFRLLAREKGMTLEEFSSYVEKNPEIDREIDGETVRAAKEGNVVIDARLSAWKAREYADIKILLTAPLEVRVKRLAERDHKTYKESLEETLKRELSEKERFKKIYNIDVDDHSVFDIIINTELWSLNSVVKILKTIVEEYITSSS